GRQPHDTSAGSWASHLTLAAPLALVCRARAVRDADRHRPRLPRPRRGRRVAAPPVAASGPGGRALIVERSLHHLPRIEIELIHVQPVSLRHPLALRGHSRGGVWHHRSFERVHALVARGLAEGGAARTRRRPGHRESDALHDQGLASLYPALDRPGGGEGVPEPARAARDGRLRGTRELDLPG